MTRATSIPLAGRRYAALVPDTLDLAERAALAVNALTGSVDSDQGYETFQGGHLDHRTPYMSHNTGGPCLQKPVQALPMMRLMSGSTQHSDYDARLLEACLRDVEADGLWWLKVAGHPGRVEYAGGDFVYIQAHAHLMVALMDWHKLDGDTRWLEYVARMADGLAGIALHAEDRSWYPHEHNWYMRQGWRRDWGAPLDASGRRPSAIEPAKPHIYTNGKALQAFARWYALSGNQRSLEMAQRLVREMLKPGVWGVKDGPTLIAQEERAFWDGHFHSYAMGMKGLAEYAIATGDEQAGRFVTDFYEYARYYGIARMGFFPAVTAPRAELTEQQVKIYGMMPGMPDEGCAISDMTWLAARLSEAGMGDYWEDVDQYVRNHLVEHQLVRRDLIEAMIESGPEHTIDPTRETDREVVERNLGCFVSISDPTWAYGWWTMCCNANVPIGLYKAWQGIVSCQGDTAQINLLLNRASPWLDIDSCLPYEGKVVLHNKTARRAYVRIPRWADRRAVRSTVNDRPANTYWIGNCLAVDGLAAGDLVTVEFPMVETVEKHSELSYGQVYTCRFKGNTLLDISPRGDRPARPRDTSDDWSKFAVNKGYPLYLREAYKADRAPLRETMRFVSDTIG